MDDDYGVRIAFCRSFIKPEMEVAFFDISKEFLKNEPLVKDDKELFDNLPIPYEDGITVYSLFT